MNIDKKDKTQESKKRNPEKSPDKVETPPPPQHMDPSKSPKKEQPKKNK